MRTGIPSVQVAVADGDAEGEVEVDGDQTTPLEGSGAPLMVTVHRVRVLQLYRTAVCI